MQKIADMKSEKCDENDENASSLRQFVLPKIGEKANKGANKEPAAK